MKTRINLYTIKMYKENLEQAWDDLIKSTFTTDLAKAKQTFNKFVEDCCKQCIDPCKSDLITRNYYCGDILESIIVSDNESDETYIIDLEDFCECITL